MVGLALVTVSKSELLSRLEENRGNHDDAYREAAQGYRAAAVEQLQAMLEEAQGGGEIRRSITALKPECHTDDYDRIIDMVTMEVSDSIELTSQEFAQYVRDEWGWKQAFTQTASQYIK